MTGKHTVYLGLGSNMGDRLGYLRSAVEMLDSSPNTQVAKRSHVYESEPEGPTQENFYNAAVEVETTLDPNGVLALCQQVENALARVRMSRWGPRSIDVDILLYDDLELHQERPNLTIPHPRMHSREFVCVPLSEIAPPEKAPDTSQCSAGKVLGKVAEL